MSFETIQQIEDEFQVATYKKMGVAIERGLVHAVGHAAVAQQQAGGDFQHGGLRFGGAGGRRTATVRTRAATGQQGCSEDKQIGRAHV